MFALSLVQFGSFQSFVIYVCFAGTNLLQSATHEIGHSLGLDHSNNRYAVMYPYVKSYDAGFKLGLDDIKGIHELYGKEMTGCIHFDLEISNKNFFDNLHSHL